MSNIANLDVLRANAIRFSILEEIWQALNFQPNDILEYVEDKKDEY